MGKENKIKRVRFTLEMLRQAAENSVIYPVCPYCELLTPAEPDAEDIFCVNCEKRFEIDNPFF